MSALESRRRSLATPFTSRAGDALVLTSSENNLSFQKMLVSNNILWAPAGYDINMTDDSAIGLSSDYNDLVVTGTGNAVKLSTRVYPQLADWVLEYGLDTHSISADPKFVNIAGADGILGYSGGGDHGADDNFHLQSGSPAIDAADPNAVFVLEPAPNGGRMNLGNYGNTPAGRSESRGSFVPVTSPISEPAAQYTVTWARWRHRTQPAWLIDAGEQQRIRQLGKGSHYRHSNHVNQRG